MARLVELMTVNVAVESVDAAARIYSAIGLEPLVAERLLEPPAQVVDLSLRAPTGGAVSLIEPTTPESPVARFLARRGPGLFSLTFRVDDLTAAMREWQVEWLYPEPLTWHDTKAIAYRVETLLLNWIMPRSLGGVLLEVFEFRGRVEPWPAAGEDGSPLP